MQLAPCIADCKFECPHFNSSMAEYMLLCKSVNCLGSVALKEVFCKCEMFSDIDSLCKFCVAYEVVCKDASRAKFRRETGCCDTAARHTT